jgi:hypothetical protein
MVVYLTERGDVYHIASAAPEEPIGAIVGVSGSARRSDCGYQPTRRWEIASFPGVTIDRLMCGKCLRARLEQ